MDISMLTTTPQDPKERLKNVKKLDSHILRLVKFLQERCVIDYEETELNKLVYQDYLEWCEEKKLKPLGKTLFGNHMVELGFPAKSLGNGYYRIGVYLARRQPDPDALDLSDIIAYTKNLRNHTSDNNKNKEHPHAPHTP